MVISNNIMAINANRQFNIVGTGKKKSIEKLSSGYRINKAADDAAGLSISEKMRSQVRGLHQASKNVQDGISMLQTADGALSEVHNMLHRITELSIQSSNDTNTAEDRQQIQKEINQLMLEIDRISDNTEFNKKKLFQGSTHRTVGTSGGSSAGGVSPSTPGGTHTEEIQLVGVSNIDWTGAPTDTSITRYVFDADVDNGISVNGTMYSWDDIKTDGGKKLSSLESGSYKITNNGLTFSLEIPVGASFEGIVNSVEDVEGVYLDVFETKEVEGITVVVNPHNSGMDENTYFDLLKGEHSVNNNKIDTKYSFLCMADKTLNESLQTFEMYSATYNSGKYDTYSDAQKELAGARFTLKPAFESVLINRQRDVGVDNVFRIDSTVRFSNTSFRDLIEYDPEHVFISPSIETSLDYDPANPQNMSFSLENGEKKYEFHLSDDSKNQMNAVKMDGGMLKKGNSYVLAFQSDETDFTMSFTINALQNISLENVISRANSFEGGVSVPGFKLRDIKTVLISDKITKDIETKKISIDGLKDGGTKTIEVEGGDDDNDPYDGSDDSYLDEEEGDWWIQAGPNALEGFYITIGRMSTKLLGLKGCDVSTWAGAQKAITQASVATDRISKQRGRIGAQQNRLEHTLYNVTNSEINAQESESRIRDTDMAEEMMKLSMRNILEQAGSSVLSQANKQPQSILSLLR